MNKRLWFYNFLLMMSVLIIFLKNCPLISAETYSHNNTDNSIIFVIPLPFNSHIADQMSNGKGYTSNIIPFP
jgi:hypothetical protein